MHLSTGVLGQKANRLQRWFLRSVHASCLCITPLPPAKWLLFWRRDRVLRWPLEAPGCELWEAGRGVRGGALTGQSKREGGL